MLSLLPALLAASLVGGTLAEDPGLDRAAESLARAAAEAADLSPLRSGPALRLAITRAGVWMGEPQVVGVITRDVEQGKARLRGRIAAQAALRPTHAGFGVAPLEDGSHAVVGIFGRIAVEWAEAVPTWLPERSHLRLRGRLLGGLEHPQVHVIPPGGHPLRLPLEREGAWFEAKLYLHTPGKTVLEVMGVGRQGPEIALLGHIYVGEEIPSGDEGEEREVLTTAEMVADLNALRSRRGLTALRSDPRLDEVARAYAQELIETERFAHNSPASGQVGDRLRSAGYDFRIAGENLGEGPDAATAHHAILQSPAHLAALLEPRFRSLGVGMAIKEGAHRTRVIIVHVLATP